MHVAQNIVIWPLSHRHGVFFSVTRKVAVLSVRPLAFVLTLTLLQETVKWIFQHPSEAQTCHVRPCLCSAIWIPLFSKDECIELQRKIEALECIWPLIQRFIQGCGIVRSCFPKVNRTSENCLKSVLKNCSFLCR